MFSEVKWNDYFDYPWKQVYTTIEKIPVTDKYNIAFKTIDTDKIMQILVEKHNFSAERISAVIKRIEEEKPDSSQKGLGDYL